MVPLLKSEFRKLLSVRSTYFTLLLALVIITIMAFWVQGYKGLGDSAAEVMSSGAYQDIFVDAAMIAGVFGGIVAILFMAHEYRYNVIMYTLTSANSRTKVLLAKIVVIVVYGAVLSLVCGFAGLLLYRFGVSFRADGLPAQIIDWYDIVWRILFYNIGQILLALMFATLTRSIPAALALVFLLPATIEPLLSLLLKDNSAYLPYAVYERIITGFGGEAAQIVPGVIPVGRAVLVALTYLIVGWFITWLIFMRRDAN